MLNLLSLEFRRLIRAKSFYVCLAVSLLMIIISAATSKMLLNLASSEEFSEALGTAATLQAPTSLSMLKTTASSSLTTILAIFLSIFVADDYTGDTIKNVYAKGYTREEIFFSKYISAMTATVCMTLVCGLFSFVMGKALFGEVGTAGTNYVPSLLTIFLIVLAYATIYFAVAISCKKTAVSIAVCILAPIILGLVLTFGDARINSDTFRLSDYWLDGRLAILQNQSVKAKDVLIGFILGAVALIAAGVSGFMINRNSDN